jgi:cytoskeletal protein RodZ
LLCDGHAHCQPASSDDELPSNCFLTIPTRSQFSLPIYSSSSPSFVRQHWILIITIGILCIAMLIVATILVVLLIKMKRRQQDVQIPNDIKKQQQEKLKRQRRRQKQQNNLSLRKKSIQTYLDDEENHQDLIGNNMVEQAVTTV